MQIERCENTFSKYFHKLTFTDQRRDFYLSLSQMLLLLKEEIKSSYTRKLNQQVVFYNKSIFILMQKIFSTDFKECPHSVLEIYLENAYSSDEELYIESKFLYALQLKVNLSLLENYLYHLRSSKPTASSSTPYLGIRSKDTPSKTIERFNPAFLRQDQKINLLVEGLSTLHRNIEKYRPEIFSCDSIGIVENYRNEYLLVLPDPKEDLYYVEKKLNYGSCFIKFFNIFEYGLDLKPHYIQDILKNYLSKGTYSDIEFSVLIKQIESLRNYSPLSIKFFQDKPLLPADEKIKIFCLIITNVCDGIGDFIHGWDFGNRLKNWLHANGYQLYALIEIDTLDNDGSDVIIKYIKERLASSSTPFDDYLVFTTLLYDHNKSDFSLWLEKSHEKFIRWYNQNEKKILKISYSAAGAISVSFHSCYMRKIFPKHVHIIDCYQYGYLYSNSRILNFHEAHMGVVDRNHPESYGIKILGTYDIEHSIENILTLSVNEPELICAMLGTSSPSKEIAREYLNSHHVLPGYLQSRFAVCAFILTQVLRFQDDGKTCDFFVPRHSVDTEILSHMLSKANMTMDKIAFITKDEMRYNSNAQVRIFSYTIEDDEDYQLIYQLTDDGAAASGDNSVTAAFSNLGIPWFEIKPDVIGRFFEINLPNLIKNCLEELKPTNPNLYEGMQALESYVYHLNRLRVLGKNYPTFDIIFNPIEKNQPKGRIYPSNVFLTSHAFFEYCRLLAIHLQHPTIQNAWRYLSKHLQQNNFYDQLENIVKCSVAFTMLSNEEIKLMLCDAHDIQQLIHNRVTTKEALLKLNTRTFPLLGFKEFHQYYSKGLTVERINKIYLSRFLNSETTYYDSLERFIFYCTNEFENELS